MVNSLIIAETRVLRFFGHLSILLQGRHLARLTARILFKKDRFDRENQNLLFVIVHIKYLQTLKLCLLNV